MVSDSRSSAGGLLSRTGATVSSAASMIFTVSMPVLIPSRSVTAANASTGVLPAPAPNRRVEPSICLAPARAARTELATPSSGVSWPGKPACAAAPGAARRRRDPVAAPVHDQRARRVDHVDALGAGVGHDPRLLRQHLGRLAVRHHPEADRLHAGAAGDLEVLDRDGGLGGGGG